MTLSPVHCSQSQMIILIPVQKRERVGWGVGVGERLKHACMQNCLYSWLVSPQISSEMPIYCSWLALQNSAGMSSAEHFNQLVFCSPAVEHGTSNVPTASVLPFVSVSLGIESVAWLAFSTTKPALKQKRKECFPVLRVGDKSALVEVVVEERRQGLAEEDVRHHQPPG